MTTRMYRIGIEVPLKAGPEVIDAIFDAVAEAAHDAEPDERDGWDIFVYGMQVDVMDDDETEQYATDLGLLT